ncbi:hypothetical protein MMC10_001463 [Thelotrema lepadinum]|nr:hypothetical protein [Thelotrema lepadinum]
MEEDLSGETPPGVLTSFSNRDDHHGQDLGHHLSKPEHINFPTTESDQSRINDLSSEEVHDQIAEPKKPYHHSLQPHRYDSYPDHHGLMNRQGAPRRRRDDEVKERREREKKEAMDLEASRRLRKEAERKERREREKKEAMDLEASRRLRREAERKERREREKKEAMDLEASRRLRREAERKERREREERERKQRIQRIKPDPKRIGKPKERNTVGRQCLGNPRGI